MRYQFDKSKNNKYIRTLYNDDVTDDTTDVAPTVNVDYAHFIIDSQTWIEVIPEADLKPMQMFATMARYEQHKADGWNYYQEFRANLVWEIDNSILTVQQAFLIENYLSIGYDKIAQNGDWMTALHKLKQITLPTAHEFVRTYLNKAIEIIEEYILNNYPQR